MNDIAGTAMQDMERGSGVRPPDDPWAQFEAPAEEPAATWDGPIPDDPWKDICLAQGLPDPDPAAADAGARTPDNPAMGL